ncbi:hypothetical protein [Adlercreutzia murintestinalis]|jgi:hypothetical protein|uniref:hypothetical protein n=1 Tax=Adlercreutzia murintestinalis TaxID=2941325 RepID=UPI00203DCF01|nr:hypothetical protein [Adlercreutzia murintestinalis]
MSNEVLPFISNEVVELFEEFDDDYLADVFRVWDCDAQNWQNGTTVVFRFENDDLLVWNVMGGLKAKRGAVDTQKFQLGALIGASEESCIAWRSDSSFADLIGRAALSATLLESFV